MERFTRNTKKNFSFKQKTMRILRFLILITIFLSNSFLARASIINNEIHSLTAEQATWRLNNWKLMIKNYRKRGYSYPTISRIKKLLQEIKERN